MKKNHEKESESIDNNENLIHWHCEKCNIRIGVVDILEQEIRIRYKDLVLYYAYDSEKSDRDKLTVLCRRCGWLNSKNKQQLNDHHPKTKK